MPLSVGAVVEGKVKSIMPFGAFVELGEGKTGLVHISEVALDYVKEITQYINVGDQVKVKILSIDEKGKINLSIKKVLEEQRKRSTRPADVDWSRQKAGSSLSFEDMLQKFKQESDEKISQLKITREVRKPKG